MGTTTIRIRSKSHEILKDIAAATGQSLQSVLEEAIEDRRRRLYLEGVNEDYASLRRSPRKLSAFQKENAAWDSTNLDGLEKE